jgi:hypothetical protein
VIVADARAHELFGSGATLCDSGVPASLDTQFGEAGHAARLPLTTPGAPAGPDDGPMELQPLLAIRVKKMVPHRIDFMVVFLLVGFDVDDVTDS